MGFQTNVTISNDFFDWVEKNPGTFVDAIRSGMNSGTHSYVSMAIERDPYPPLWTEGERKVRNHYVTVHQACHADVPQVIYTHQNNAYQIHDLYYGIEKGYLDLVENTEMHVKIYRRIATELRRQAKALDKALNDYEEKHANE